MKRDHEVPTSADFSRLALSLPNAREQETWGHPTYRVGAKMFAAMAADGESASVKATKTAQRALVGSDPSVFSVPPYVGVHGWIGIELARVDPEELRELVIEAWMLTAPKRLVREFEMRETLGVRDPRVDEYLAALPEWQRRLGEQLRDLIRAADPEIAETIKRKVQPYFVLEGNVCALLAAKDHLNLFLYDGAIVPDPDGIITAGHDNKTARTISFYEGDTINAPALTQMLRRIAANNRAGGWRKLKPGLPPAGEGV